MKIKVTLFLALIGSYSFAQNTWDGSTIGTTTTNGLVGIGGTNANSRLYILNPTSPYGLNIFNSTGITGNQYGIYQNLSGSTSTGSKYGIFSNVTGTSPSKFGVYTTVTNSGSSNSATTPTSFGIYARGTGTDTRAGYFLGDVEYSTSNSIFSGGNGSKTMLYTNTSGTDNGMSFVINQTDNAYDWDWTQSFALMRNGQMIKRINSTGLAFSIQRFGQSDVFRVYGDGSVYATSVYVKLASQFPDYVFKPDYKLMPIKDVKKFISENGHLPNIEDAQTVKEKGINTGELTVKLVEKVEELTLYVIQLNEEIEKLKRDNQKLKNE